MLERKNDRPQEEADVNHCLPFSLWNVAYQFEHGYPTFSVTLWISSSEMFIFFNEENQINVLLGISLAFGHRCLLVTEEVLGPFECVIF